MLGFFDRFWFGHNFTDEEDINGDLRDNCVSLTENIQKKVTSLSKSCPQFFFFFLANAGVDGEVHYCMRSLTVFLCINR